MSNKNFKIPQEGNLIFEVDENNKFQALHVVYDDQVFALTRRELIGKTREELLDEIEYILTHTQALRDTFAAIISNINCDENTPEHVNDFIEKFKASDPEVCKLCNID